MIFKNSFLVTFVALSALAAAACFALPAQARGGKPEPRLHVSIALENNHLLLGEPVVLRYEIHTEGANLSLPFEQKAPWLHVELQNTKGKVVASTDFESVRGTGMLTLQTATNLVERQEYFYVTPDYPFADRLVLGGKRLAVPEAGKYEVVVRATSFWTAVPNTFERTGGRRGSILQIGTPVETSSGPIKVVGPVHLPISIKPEPTASGLPQWADEASHFGKWDKEIRVNQRFILPLTVEKDDAALTKKAEVLRQVLQTGTLPSPTATQALFSLSGSPAQQVQWALMDELAAKPGGFTLTLLLREVVRLSTPEALAFVTDYSWNRRRFGISGDLATLYNFADRDVQEEIEKLFALYGKPFPENVAVVVD